MALYGVFISLTVMQLGFVVMLSTPTWPAVAEALAREDLPWARKAAKRLYRFGSGFAVCSARDLSVGPWVLPLWLGKEFSNIGRPLLACYGLYFVAHVWRHLNHTMMIGTGQVSRLVGIQLFESAVVAAVAWGGMSLGGAGAMLAGDGRRDPRAYWDVSSPSGRPGVETCGGCVKGAPVDQPEAHGAERHRIRFPSLV